VWLGRLFDYGILVNFPSPSPRFFVIEQSLHPSYAMSNTLCFERLLSLIFPTDVGDQMLQFLETQVYLGGGLG
jgi:hypothetical protein